MHTDWPSAINLVRSESACVFCTTLLVGIQNAAATSKKKKKKKKKPGLYKGNTGSQTLDYSLLPKGLDSYGAA